MNIKNLMISITDKPLFQTVFEINAPVIESSIYINIGIKVKKWLFNFNFNFSLKLY